jgi:biopolymer transport protein TolR
VSWWRKKRRGTDVVPDMNVTPLVDVVLVLLIIFMVVMPQMDKDVKVELPGIFNPDPEVEGNLDPFKVSVPKWGEFHFNGQQYDLDGLMAVLGSEHAADPARRLVLRGDAKLEYGDVRLFMARAQQMGFPGVNFMVGEKHKAGARPTTGYGDQPAAPPAAEGSASATPAGTEG